MPLLVVLLVGLPFIPRTFPEARISRGTVLLVKGLASVALRGAKTDDIRP